VKNDDMGSRDLRPASHGQAGLLRDEPRLESAVERVIDGPGGALALRVLAAEDVRGCYVHMHGGGWAMGGADRQDQTLSHLARAAGLAVVAVHYRLTPEHPHPAAVADCAAAISWLVVHGERQLGSSRVIVGGESSGAHLAALALLVLRDRGEVAAVAGANLAYGVYDVSMTPSARLWGPERMVISTPDLESFAAQYAPLSRHRDADVSPLYADLAGLPPALFSCGTLDPLLDDSLFMAARWRQAGNEAALDLYPGAPHEFLNLQDSIPAERLARERMLAFVGSVLTR
jgi:acetyl esterase/lipase